ncbi:hypothetical protein D0Z00_000474 [Geotrichum galactomycetum]|uniref:Uncharacterized protein n=1 Tax=Geotrichum galactomycetum TaxID=27317 RepID=A0ACB6V9Y5_9ASCO|nr:hypothetical protein D0Z00_000474 [Geotrichum candidum]
MKFLLSLLAASSLVSAALSPITVKGNAFYDSKTNKRFFIKGVDYLPGGSSDFSDPLLDIDVCKRDIEYFKDLGLNSIRVYSVDNSGDHSECMKLLDEAGIYLILDVNTPKNSINRASPANSYNTAYLQHVFATIDAFKDYDNLLGFFAANEVINDENTTSSAPYVKATIRDMKAYIKAQSKRSIPVGYSAADISANRLQQAEYFNCGSDEERLDMFGMNDYSWCGKSSFSLSGYDKKVETYSGYTKPMFLSEFGCNEITPRPFTEVEAIYSTDMSSVFSGGLVYEYSEEDNKYGLVEISKSGEITKKTDYNNLKSELAKVEMPSGDAGASTKTDASKCPAYEAGVWEVDPDAAIPSMPKRASAFLTDGAGKALGTNGPNTSYGDEGDIADNQAAAEKALTAKTTSKAPSATASGSAAAASAVSASASASASASGNAAAAIAPAPLDFIVVAPLAVLLSSTVFGALMVL